MLPQPEESSDSYIYLHLPYIYLWTGFGPAEKYWEDRVDSLSPHPIIEILALPVSEYASCDTRLALNRIPP